MIKRTILFSAFLICIAGCFIKNSSVNTFDDLRQQVGHTLGKSCECSSIMTNEVTTNLFFEVKCQQSFFAVTITKREFIAPKEWEARYQAGTNFFNSVNTTNLVKDISTITNHPHFSEQFSNLLDSMSLPSWHYKNIGVEVNLPEPEIADPDIDKNYKEAQKIYDKILSCLEPYQKKAR